MSTIRDLGEAQSSQTTELVSLKVLENLRLAIQQNKLKPGQHLVEEEIAKQMGVSRVPVRQAIHILQRDGLVVIEPHRGASVINLSDQDIEEIYGLRIALEMYAIAQAVVRARPDEIDELQSIVDQMRKQASEDVPPDQNQLDLKFHETICRMGGNRKLLESWQKLSTQIRMVLALKNLINNDSQTLPEGHQRVVNAIRQRDAVTAQQILVEHIKASAKRVLKGSPAL